MPAASLDLADWYRALTLAERAALGIPENSTVSGEDPHARHRLAEWRGAAAFQSGPWWGERLAALGLSQESFERLIALPPHELGATATEEPPAWITEIADRTVSAAGLEPLSISPELGTAAGFLELVRPLIERARLRLQGDLAALVEAAKAPLPFTVESALRLASEALPYRLLPVLSRTLVLELNVARLQGLLAGETPEERFASFVERLRDPEAAEAILREYPVLARQMLLDLELFRETTAEVFSHLAADWPEIVARFFDNEDPGLLTALDGGAGDRHRRGRAVRLLTFASGARLVYKPRSLAVESHFQELLAWVNGAGEATGAPRFRILEVLDREEHGWMEFAAAEPCRSPAEVALFHERLGGLLAVLYSLAATDCHYENLIAAGEHPVVIDLESLFHPQIQRGKRARPQEDLRSQFALHSVLRVGLLPFQVGQSDDFEGVDISGVAAVDGQPTPQKVIQWQGTGTDEMRVVRDRAIMEGGHNRPFLDGKPVQVGEYREEMTRGFAAVYRLLAGRREEMTRVLERFADDPVRVVLRPTQIYGLLLLESFHPDYLRDALDRDRLFDRLWLEAESQPNLARVIAAEHRDLWDGDVPSFSSLPSSRDVWTSRGERVADFLEESSFELVRRRIELLGEEDLRRQLWLLRLSLGTQLLNRDDVEWTSYQPDPDAPRLSPEERRESLLRHARAVGDWFAEMAVREEGYASWIGLEFRDKRWSLEPTPDDLYAGLPGIALFLGFLGEIAGDAGATRLARAAIATLLLQLEAWKDDKKGPASIGAFQGWGGTIWTLAHLGHLWHDRELLAEGERIVEVLPDLLAGDQDLDLIGGSAGAILGLLALHEALGSPTSSRALEVAIQCGERLVGLAVPWGSGLGWLTRLASEKPLAGVSHGVGGIALALLRLGALTGDERFLAAGLGGFAGERERFWGDLDRLLHAAQGENPPPESTVAVAWCYGAPGVGLTRIKALPYARSDEERAAFREEIELAVNRTLSRGPGQNHCLCHGDLGNLDFLLQAQEAVPSPGLAAAIDRFLEIVLASLDRDGWLCGTRGSIESPGLMNGFAGIGLGLLRMAEPERVPSVLGLASP
ncbi:MAG TPA: type 2 lanthipeptide synthetase LanM family protein [Thermoanaerobaculia bacterium]|nr:type 2 lanthipeptide synthetase LanM family protein [Thermoanaerobaculia bacterium]